MEEKLGWFANVASAAGILICVFAGLFRLAGSYYIAGFQSVTLFVLGAALVLVACLAKLYQLEARLK